MASAAEGAPKRCYYDVLGLPRDCSPTDIKLAFRRLALSLHPDKQPPGSDTAAATAAFQELQHAHSVLSDPHERAYYDSHRSQILFSDSSISASSGNASPVPDLFAFFSSSAFSGFSDTGRGFYKVYGDVFGKVFAQELAYARRMGVTEPPAPPVIGNLDSPYAQVTAFYNYWLGFATVMDFGWAAEWDAARGENRRVRRLMEEDNKKAMRKAKREYNDAVRGLAAFCKKRDKRVVDMALKKKAEEEKKKAEKERKKEEERRKKERAMAYQEPEWAKVQEEEGVFDEEEEEQIQAKRKEELYCVACNKKFKSDKQWKNHEQSKKHRDKIAELKMVFEEEEEEEALKEAEEEVEGDWNEADVGFDFKPTQESDESEWSDAAEELAEELEEGLEVHDKEDGEKNFENAEQEVGSYDETSVLEAMLSSRKNRKGGYVVPPEEALSSSAEYEDDDRSSEVNNVKKKGRRRRASKKEQDEGTYADNEQHAKSEVQPESGHDNDENVADKMEELSSSNDDGASLNKEDQQKGKNNNPKKNKKNKKGAAKKATVSADQKSTSKGKKQKEASKALSNDCDTCGTTFESRNKLFSHLEETGHAMLKARQRKR